MRIAHTSLNVRCAATARAFYEAVGFVFRGRLVFPTKYYLYFSLPGTETALELGIAPERKKPYDHGDGYANLALVVPDLDALLARLEVQGIVPLSPPYHPHGRTEFRICVIVDPDGYRIELIEGAAFAFPQDEEAEI